MNTLLTYSEIDKAQWKELIENSSTATWFQTEEAYRFYESLPELFQPFVVGVASLQLPPKGKRERPVLRGVCGGYVTKEKSAVKQFFTRRAIIIGGPALAKDCSADEVEALMRAVRSQLDIGYWTLDILNAPIYIETRNLNDYSRWKDAFAKAGFRYEPHLNFHIDPRVDNLSENRHRQVRQSNAEIEIIENKNNKNTACANINKENKNTHSTSAMSDGPRGLERNHPQALTSELVAPVDANTPNLLPDEQHVECLQKCVVPPCENDKNENTIREWYEILRELYRTKVKTPLWPMEFFMEAYQQGVGTFMMVKHEGKVVGGSMVVKGGGVVYEWYACGSNSSYKEQHPSVMATWAGIQWAKEQGCTRYDMMGAGKPDEEYGVRDFKAEFGGEMVEHGRFLCVCKPLLYRFGKLGVKLLRMANN